MVQVRLAKHLLRFVEAPSSCQIEAETVAGLIDALEANHAGIKSYIVQENGELRQHVHIFLDEVHLDDRATQSDSLENISEVVIMQALSGG